METFFSTLNYMKSKIPGLIVPTLTRGLHEDFSREDKGLVSSSKALVWTGTKYGIAFVRNDSIDVRNFNSKSQRSAVFLTFVSKLMTTQTFSKRESKLQV